MKWLTALQNHLEINVNPKNCQIDTDKNGNIVIKFDPPNCDLDPLYFLYRTNRNSTLPEDHPERIGEANYLTKEPGITWRDVP